LDERERGLDDRHDSVELREVTVSEREADIARITNRADRVEVELEAQREALRDAEEAVMRERQVLQRRMAEIEDRADAARQAREEAVRRVSDDPNAGSSGKKGLLRRDAPTAKAVEELHVVLREREVELEEQERRLGELSTSLQRREADLNAMARKLQLSAGSSANGSASEDADEPRPSKREDVDPTQKRLQFWSR
jgi:chromosome segregation ATPase